MNAAFQEAAGDAVVQEGARVQRRAARVGRHRRQPGVVHLLVHGHDGERQHGQDARLVRQRVGVLQPARRHRRLRRRSASSAARRSPHGAPDTRRPRRRARDACARAGRLQRAAARRRGRGRPAHRDRRADDLEWLREHGAVVVVCGHLGRPEGRCRTREYSMAPVARRLGELLGTEVPLAPAVVGPDGRAGRRRPRPARCRACSRTCASIPAETENDPASRPRSTELGRRYVNDAFGASHRAHASIVGPPGVLPQRGRQPAAHARSRCSPRLLHDAAAARSSRCSAARRSATSSA